MIWRTKYDHISIIKEGKAILKHVTAKEIGITQQELNDVRKGLAMVELQKSNQSNAGQMHADFCADTNGYGLYVRLSVNDIKNGLIVGVLAGGILALGRIFTESVAQAAAGVIVGVITNIAWIEADMLPTTIYIPNESLASGYGPMYIYNSVHTVTALYWP